MEQIASQEPTPEFAAQLVEELQGRLAALPSADLRKVAQGKLEGSTNAEIATQLGFALRSVERKLRVIRSIWRQPDKAPPEAPGG